MECPVDRDSLLINQRTCSSTTSAPKTIEHRKPAIEKPLLIQPEKNMPRSGIATVIRILMAASNLRDIPTCMSHKFYGLRSVCFSSRNLAQNMRDSQLKAPSDIVRRLTPWWQEQG